MLRFLILLQLFIVFLLLLLFFFHLGEVLQAVFVADKVDSPEKKVWEKFVVNAGFLLFRLSQHPPAPKPSCNSVGVPPNHPVSAPAPAATLITSSSSGNKV